jgi:hypothetical protein
MSSQHETQELNNPNNQSESNQKENSEKTDLQPNNQENQLNSGNSEHNKTENQIPSQNEIQKNENGKTQINEDAEIKINDIKNSNLGFINPEYYDEFNRPKYEEIVKYENSIREEMEKNTPLVSDLLDIELLRAEYKDSIFEKAIDDFFKKINKWRTIRRDGNCFYRSFLFRLFEEFIQRRDVNLHKNLTKLVEDSKDLCNENGYCWLVLEDFYNVNIRINKFIF